MRELAGSSSFEFEVAGLPPAKSEALSMLGSGHPHRDRVKRLLSAVQEAAQETGFAGFEGGLLGMEVVLRSPDPPPSDATNYLGGIADVLEAKEHRGRLDHLGPLAAVALYDNDRQLRELHFRHEPGLEAYAVRLWAL